MLTKFRLSAVLWYVLVSCCTKALVNKFVDFVLTWLMCKIIFVWQNLLSHASRNSAASIKLDTETTKHSGTYSSFFVIVYYIFTRSGYCVTAVIRASCYINWAANVSIHFRNVWNFGQLLSADHLSVLWHCWLGDIKGIRPVKCWFVGGDDLIGALQCTSHGSSYRHHFHHP